MRRLTRWAVLALLACLAAPAAAHAQLATFEPLETFGTGPLLTGVGTAPGDVAVDVDGSVWVVDRPGNRVVK